MLSCPVTEYTEVSDATYANGSASLSASSPQGPVGKCTLDGAPWLIFSTPLGSSVLFPLLYL